VAVHSVMGGCGVLLPVHDANTAVWHPAVAGVRRMVIVHGCGRVENLAGLPYQRSCRPWRARRWRCTCMQRRTRWVVCDTSPRLHTHTTRTCTSLRTYHTHTHMYHTSA
jgi:hypothetical protein